jgi:2-methylcitrate dehydratase PrpD
MSRSISTTLASWIEFEATQRLSPALAACTKNRLLDWLLCCLASYREHSSQVAAHYGTYSKCGEGATIFLTGGSAGAPIAAFANGVAAYTLELLDEHHGMLGHPGAAVLPAVLAVAEMRNVSGVQLLRAIVFGYEVSCRLGSACRPGSVHARGFHPTSVFGVFGAAAASAWLLGGKKHEIAAAMGIAGSQASGLFQFGVNGHMAKPFNAGWAAQSGVTAAQLATHGFLGPEQIFEGENGVLRAFAGDNNYDLSLITTGLGQEHEIEKSAYKAYACGSYIHSSVDALLSAMQQYKLTADEIIRIDAYSASEPVRVVGSPLQNTPRDILEARLSMPFVLAVAAYAAEEYSRGDPLVKHITKDSIAREDVVDLALRVQCHGDASFDTIFPVHYPARVVITTKNGEFEQSVPTHLGDPSILDTTFTEDDLTVRFGVLAELLPHQGHGEKITDVVNAIYSEEKVAGLLRSCASFEPT